MWMVLGLALLLAWGLGLVVFKIASAAIHVLVAAALVAGALHLYHRYRGRTRSDTLV